MDRYPGGQFPYSTDSSGPRSPPRQPVNLRRPGARFFWDSPAMPMAATPRRRNRRSHARQSTLDLQAVRLRDFTVDQSGVPTLLCTPLALHGAAIADLAAGHSLVAALRDAGIRQLFMTDWRSASAEMRFLGIDEYLAELNVLVDHLGGLVNLIGLCQGGWLSLVYAGQFPAKVRKLVMAGAPVDIAARQSRLSAMAEATPLIMFQSLVNLGAGRVIGRNIAKFWGNSTRRKRYSQILAGSSADRLVRIHAARGNLQELEFLDHRSSGRILPGSDRETLQAQRARHWKLGRAGAKEFDLSRLRLPMYLLAGSADEVVAPEQLLAVERLVGDRGIYPPRDRAVSSSGSVYGKADA